MRIFEPFRAIGYITNNVPFSVQRLGTETFVTVCIGKAWQIYNCAKLNLVLVGPQLQKKIRALASYVDYTFDAYGNHIVVFKRAHQIPERVARGRDEGERRTGFCAFRLHPDGICSCESFSSVEESSTLASISQIIMVAEALFEVLDEIHQQPLSFSQSNLTVPVPESVVDSFPIESYRKLDATESKPSDIPQVCPVYRCRVCEDLVHDSAPNTEIPLQ